MNKVTIIDCNHYVYKIKTIFNEMKIEITTKNLHKKTTEKVRKLTKEGSQLSYINHNEPISFQIY